MLLELGRGESVLELSSADGADGPVVGVYVVEEDRVGSVWGEHRVADGADLLGLALGILEPAG